MIDLGFSGSGRFRLFEWFVSGLRFELDPRTWRRGFFFLAKGHGDEVDWGSGCVRAWDLLEGETECLLLLVAVLCLDAANHSRMHAQAIEAFECFSSAVCFLWE